MVIVVLISVVLVVGMKFFTATRMRDLERRLNRVKDGLIKTKESFEQSKMRQAQVATEEEQESERIRFMKELIRDIQLRLQLQDEPTRDYAVDASPQRF